MLLRDYVDQYLLERNVSAIYAQAVRAVASEFGAFLTRDAALADLTGDAMNRFLVHLTARHKSRWTVRGKRGRLLAVWRSATDEGLAPPPLRIRRMPRPKHTPQAWSLDELTQLLAVADSTPGRFRKSRIPKREYWRALVLVGYDTGLRLADLMDLRFIQVRQPVFSIVQRKTGVPILCRLGEASREAIESLEKSSGPLVFAGALCRQHFFKEFRAFVGRAGLTGTSRWLRRTSGTWVEHEHPGTGHLRLGNSREVFEAHYDDRTKREIPPLPPRIA